MSAHHWSLAFLTIGILVVMCAAPVDSQLLGASGGVVTVLCGLETIYGPMVDLNTTFLLQHVNHHGPHGEFERNVKSTLWSDYCR